MKTDAATAAWDALWTSFGVPSDAALLARLIECYSEPHRHYHSMQHIEECFLLLEQVRNLADRPHEIALALWFHDAIYDTKSKDNEERCAQWARETVLAKNLRSDVAERVGQLILVTKHNAVPSERDAEVLVDIDLGILGALPDRFDEYEAQVRREYSWVPAILYRRERRKVLEEFARRPAIYSAGPVRDRREQQARANIARSLARL